MKKMAKSL